MFKNSSPSELAERARQLAEKRDRQAVSADPAWREQHLKATAANYRALAHALEQQTARMHSVREELAVSNAAQTMARELANHGKANYGKV